MPTLPGEQQQSAHFLAHKRPHHTRSYSYQVPPGLQVSPLDTSGMTASPQIYSTPPSPKGSHHPRPAGRPMYMPAVLRPCDEFPSHRVTRTETASSTSSNDSDSTLRRANTTLMSLPGLAMFGQRLARRSPGENNKTLDGQWNLNSFPEVTDLPTRMHWKVSFFSFSFPRLSVCSHSAPTA